MTPWTAPRIESLTGPQSADQVKDLASTREFTDTNGVRYNSAANS